MPTLHNVIRRPVLTEKGTRLREQTRPQILFEVDRGANKIEIAQAVAKLFNVTVLAVHTQIVRGKEKRVGRFSGRRPNWKKAIVTLAEGQTIDFFPGV